MPLFTALVTNPISVASDTSTRTTRCTTSHQTALRSRCSTGRVFRYNRCSETSSTTSRLHLLRPGRVQREDDIKPQRWSIHLERNCFPGRVRRDFASSTDGNGGLSCVAFSTIGEELDSVEAEFVHYDGSAESRTAIERGKSQDLLHYRSFQMTKDAYSHIEAEERAERISDILDRVG